MNLKEFAKTLGLSQTTVSRALNGYPEVSESTRRRVVEMADRLNYRPNARARSLATGRSMAMGHVIPLSTKNEMLNPVFGDFIAGASDTYARAGYDLVMSVVSDEDEASAYRQLALTRAVDGIIVHAPRQNDPRVPLLKDIGLPFVVHGRASTGDADYSWLDVNNRRGFQRATDHLIDLGHSRIALINGAEPLDFAIRRREGYERALTRAGIAIDPEIMRSDEMTEYYGYTSTRHMLGLSQAPTAFLVSSIISAIGVRRAIEERGLVMGRDVSVITYDDDLSYFRTGEEEPAFTVLRASVREAGRRAAEMLLTLVESPCRPPLQQLLELDFLLGRSSGPPPSQ